MFYKLVQVHVALKLPQIALIEIHAYINKFYQYQTLQILQNQNFNVNGTCIWHIPNGGCSSFPVFSQ